jgi:hypothetical protein
MPYERSPSSAVNGTRDKSVQTPRAARRLDALARRVYCVDLSERTNSPKFKNGLAFVTNNLEELLKSLVGPWPRDPRISRNVESLRFRAQRLLTRCRVFVDHFDELEDWRTAANQINADYDVLRHEAGRLHQLVLPSSFAVLRSAL